MLSAGGGGGSSETASASVGGAAAGSGIAGSGSGSGSGSGGGGGGAAAAARAGDAAAARGLETAFFFRLLPGQAGCEGSMRSTPGTFCAIRERWRSPGPTTLPSAACPISTG